MALEEYVLDIMDGKRKGRPILRALSYLYRGGVAFRNLAYDSRLMRTEKAPLPVVSIGNIVAGGTGKTPLVAKLARELSARVAILSRGYRSDAEKSGRTLRVMPTTTAQECGDEPFWLAREVPQAAVWVGKNRCLSAKLAHEAGAQLIILDDGMQYRRLERDIEIVVMDGGDLFGKGHFLPRGLLRDAPQRLQKADLIVVNQADSAEGLSLYTDAPIVCMEMQLEAPLQGRKVGLFCAIGRPERFMQAVRKCGAEIVATFFKPDHEAFSAEELNAFAKRSGADLLVCTEKDHVKLPADLACKPSILPLAGKLTLTSGQETWQNLIQTIENYL